MARTINDINNVRMAAGMGLVALTDGLVLGLAAIGFMMYINPYLTLISIIPAPIIVYLSRKLTRRMSSGYEMVQKRFSDLTEKVREAFAGIRVIKAYTREPWEYGLSNSFESATDLSAYSRHLRDISSRSSTSSFMFATYQ